jgi:hypothetical protein
MTEEKAEKAETTRRKYRNDEWTDEQVQARKAELTVEEIPEGWVKLADVAARYQLEDGVTVSRLVAATGGDRCMNDPIHPDYRVVYVGRTRYMPPEALTSGLERMQGDPNYAKKKRAKKEKDEGDGETGAVKSAKKAPKRLVVTK